MTKNAPAVGAAGGAKRVLVEVEANTDSTDRPPPRQARPLSVPALANGGNGKSHWPTPQKSASRPGGASFGKPDHTGRSSGKLTGRIKKQKTTKPPFIQLSRELITSAAWRARSINTVRLIDALVVDYLNHACRENGNLMATYDQQVAWGASRRLIPDAIDEGQFLGLIRVDYGGRWAGTNEPSRYRLTWLYDDRNDTLPTNEWKGVTEGDIKRWRADRRQDRSEKQFPSALCGTTVVPLRALPNRIDAGSST